MSNSLSLVSGLVFMVVSVASAQECALVEKANQPGGIPVVVQSTPFVSTDQSDNVFEAKTANVSAKIQLYDRSINVSIQDRGGKTVRTTVNAEGTETVSIFMADGLILSTTQGSAAISCSADQPDEKDCSGGPQIRMERGCGY